MTRLQQTCTIHVNRANQKEKSEQARNHKITKRMRKSLY